MDSEINKQNKDSRILYSAIICILLFILSFTVFSCNNNFNAFFHPDEPGKIDIIVHNNHKFFHPLLLLQPGIAYHKITGESNPQKLTAAGRNISAVYCALAVICFMCLAKRICNTRAALLTGILLTFCPMLVVHAHYFKEDSALLFGLSLFFLSLKIYEEKRNIPSLIFLALGTAVSASGKYSGGITAIFGLLFILLTNIKKGEYKNNLKSAGIYILATVIFVFILNFQIFIYFSEFLEGIKTERAHITSKHQGLKMHLFGTFYPNILLYETPAPILFFAVIYLLHIIISAIKSRELKAENMFLIFIIGYSAMVMSIPVQISRYFLPVVVYFYIISIKGFVLSSDWLLKTLLHPMFSRETRRRLFNLHKFLMAAIYLLVLSTPILITFDYLGQFKNDSRQRLEKWADKNIPAGSKIGCDYYTLLHKDKETFNDKTDSKHEYTQMIFIGLLGSIEEARQQGINYIAVTDLAYDRFFEPNTYIAPKNKNKTNVRLCKQFYEDLFTKEELVWKSKPSRNIRAFTNPEIRVYKLYSIQESKPAIEQEAAGTSQGKKH